MMLLVVASVAAFYAVSLSRSFDGQTQTIEHAFPDASVRPPAPTGPAMIAQNILLLGSDSRAAVGEDIDAIRAQRSDTIVIVHIPANRDHVYVMSILRDSWVDIPGYGKAKINAALSWGGVPLAIQTIENFLSTRIDHVAIVDLQGFKAVTDALGGVVVDNAEAFRAGRHVFPVGPQRLDGSAALAFVRERLAFADGDFQRVRNQQAFMKAVIGTALGTETMLDPGKFGALVASIAPFLTVDRGFDSAYVGGLALQLQSVRSDEMTFFTAPTAGIRSIQDGQSIVNVDWQEMPLLQKAFHDDTLEILQPVEQHMR